MSDSIRELILQNLKTTLEAITTGNGYNKTIVRVDRVRSNPVNHVEFPSINIYEQRMNAQVDPKGYKTKSLPVVLEVWNNVGGDDPSKIINLHLADIEKRIMVDPTRGGYAIDTQYDGDEMLLVNGDELLAGAFCYVTILYRTNISNPNSIE